jgi:hypothetical protein
VTLLAPTPRTTNDCGTNVAPVLAPIGNKFVHQGQTLTFTNSATDSEAPPQVLTFSLDAGAPLAAQIDPGTGLFTWSTVGVPAPSTNFATVRVADNGTPSLSDFETVGIVVLAPLNIGSLSRTGDQLTLRWETIPGQIYGVEYKNDLNASTWTPLDNGVTASGSSLSVTVSVNGPPPRRFYRVHLVQ